MHISSDGWHIHTPKAPGDDCDALLVQILAVTITASGRPAVPPPSFRLAAEPRRAGFRAAGVTRGALYHQFRDKAGLFAAVAEEVEAEIAERIAAGAAAESSEPTDVLRASARLSLQACAEPEVERIILLDAPAVLGWEAWRDFYARYGFGLVQLALQSAMDAGAIVKQPVTPLAHALIGALDECALYVARAEDQATARQECAAIFDQILRGLSPGGQTTAPPRA